MFLADVVVGRAATVSRCHTVIFRDGSGCDLLRLHRFLFPEWARSSRENAIGGSTSTTDVASPRPKVPSLQRGGGWVRLVHDLWIAQPRALPVQPGIRRLAEPRLASSILSSRSASAFSSRTKTRPGDPGSWARASNESVRAVETGPKRKTGTRPELMHGKNDQLKGDDLAKPVENRKSPSCGSDHIDALPFVLSCRQQNARSNDPVP